MQRSIFSRQRRISSEPGKRNIFRSFVASESGAVTADWVLLTSALVILALVCVTAIGMGVIDLATDVAALEASSSALTGDGG